MACPAPGRSEVTGRLLLVVEKVGPVTHRARLALPGVPASIDRRLAPRHTTSAARRRQQFVLVLLLLGLPTLYMGFFLGYPIARAIYLSMTNVALTGPQAAHSQFVGLNNYTTLFTSAQFWQSLKASLEYLAGSGVIGQVVVGFFLAVFIGRLPRLARSVLLGVMVTAWVIPEIVAAFVWSGFLSTPDGLLNRLIGFAGVAPVPWLYGHGMLSLIIANSWRGVAFTVLVLGAALEAVPKEILESAQVDGASEWALTRRIRLPLIRTPLATVLALTTLWTLADFTLVFVLSSGTGNSTDVLPVYTYLQSFSFYELGYGTALSLVLLLLACGLAYAYVRLGASQVR
jgi:multiple sugar transport system permease protein